MEARSSVAEVLPSEDAPSWIIALDREKKARGNWNMERAYSGGSSYQHGGSAGRHSPHEEERWGLQGESMCIRQSCKNGWLAGVSQGHVTTCIDIDCAFLNAPLKEEVYAKLKV